MSAGNDCPDCGRQTLTQHGISVEYADGSTHESKNLECINCGWSEKHTETEDNEQ